MSRSISLQELAYTAMDGMNVYERREWMIYSARAQACPRCGVAAGAGCENLSKRKRGIVELVKNPHDERIDWKRLVDGLTERGYRSEAGQARREERLSLLQQRLPALDNGEPPDLFNDPIETMPEWAR